MDASVPPLASGASPGQAQPQTRQPSRAWLTVPRLLRPVRNVSDTDERAFSEYVDDLLRQLGVVSAFVMLACTVLWWPLDPIVIPED